MTRRGLFRPHVSVVVVEEARMGDADLSQRRLAMMSDLPLLELSQEARLLASAIVESKLVPAQAAVDALHIAVAADNGMEHLITWNCRHIANARMRSVIERMLRLAEPGRSRRCWAWSCPTSAR